VSVSRDVVDHEDLVDTGVPTSAQFETTHVETPLRVGAQGPAAPPGSASVANPNRLIAH
jgi:hypothetical protein